MVGSMLLMRYRKVLGFWSAANSKFLGRYREVWYMLNIFMYSAILSVNPFLNCRREEYKMLLCLSVSEKISVADKFPTKKSGLSLTDEEKNSSKVR
jgi:hypothetical protein